MDCLADDTLWDFAAGRLGPEALPAVSAHLDGCASCRGILVGVVRLGQRLPDYRELVEVRPEHYVLGQELARGGMGRIIAAHDRRLGRDVAIKELLHDTPELRARFEREARITARLQHPGIVSIMEAGTWPGGEPFYVMKRVSGESLDRAIARATTTSERLALLPAILGVSQALAYAHARRVIHRDLKPENVLVGAFGETVVIDWGLAKDLAAADDERDPGASGPFRSQPASPGDTAHGAILGTPAYMPPEQATGAEVDQRADVYALGALLYHLLAGAPPYQGSEIREQLLAGPPRPLPASVPRDLVTIVETAMARDPAARYPHAGALAAELARFQTGQLVASHRYSAAQLLGRWLRRHRAAVAVAAIAVGLLTSVAVVSVRRIVRAQELAERHRAAAEDLVKVMLVDLYERLEPLGKLDILATAAKAAQRYYEAIPLGATAEEAVQRSLALESIGDVLLKEGDGAGALSAYGSAISLRGDIGDVWHEGATGQEIALSRLHSGLAYAHLMLGDLPAARQASAQAIQLVESVKPLDQHRAMQAYNQAAQLARQAGDLAAAQASYRRGLALAEQLADERDALGHIVQELADVLVQSGQVAEAGQMVKDTMARLGSAAAPYTVASLEQTLGNILLQQGQLAEALAAQRHNVSLMQEIAAGDPTNAELQDELAGAHGSLGNILEAMGDVPGALAAFEAQLAVAQALVQRAPGSAAYVARLGEAEANVAALLLAAGQLEPAQAHAEQAVARFADRPRDLAMAETVRGDVLEARKDLPGALAAYRHAVSLLQPLVQQDPANLRLLGELAQATSKVGDLLLAAGDAAGALAQYQLALPMAEQLARADASNLEAAHNLATAHASLGDAHLALHHPDAARASYQAALAVAEPLARAHPDDPWNAIVDDLRRRSLSER